MIFWNLFSHSFIINLTLSKLPSNAIPFVFDTNRVSQIYVIILIFLDQAIPISIFFSLLFKDEKILMPARQLLTIFRCRMPSIDKLYSYKAVVQIIISKYIGTETSPEGYIVRYLIVQGKSEIPNIKF
jgi:hypothetical protein